MTNYLVVVLLTFFQPPTNVEQPISRQVVEANYGWEQYAETVKAFNRVLIAVGEIEGEYYTSPLAVPKLKAGYAKAGWNCDIKIIPHNDMMKNGTWPPEYLASIKKGQRLYLIKINGVQKDDIAKRFEEPSKAMTCGCDAKCPCGCKEGKECMCQKKEAPK